MRVKKINENNHRDVSAGKFLFQTGVAGVRCMFLGGHALMADIPWSEMQWICKADFCVWPLTILCGYGPINFLSGSRLLVLFPSFRGALQ